MFLNELQRLVECGAVVRVTAKKEPQGYIAEIHLSNGEIVPLAARRAEIRVFKKADTVISELFERGVRSILFEYPEN